MNVNKIAAPQKLLPEDPGFQCAFLYNLGIHINKPFPPKTA